jgi:hypothetical protein
MRLERLYVCDANHHHIKRAGCFENKKNRKSSRQTNSIFAALKVFTRFDVCMSLCLIESYFRIVQMRITENDDLLYVIQLKMLSLTLF